MLITFTTDAFESISYFSDIAIRLIQLMGHSGTVPGAIKAHDLPEALAKLQQSLEGHKSASGTDVEDEPVIGLRQRAVPLVQLLQAAIKKDCDVLWDRAGRPI